MRWRDIPFDPPQKTLRWFAVYGATFLTALAAWRYLHEDAWLALALLLGGLLVCALGAFRPALLRLVFVASMIVTFPLGWVTSKVVLFVLFFGIFTPLGLFFRLVGRDALSLRLERESKSYWIDKPAAPDVRGYFRQS